MADIHKQVDELAALVPPIANKRRQKKTPKAVAREFLAKQRGIKPKSLKEAERRSRNKAAARAAKLAPVVESYGMELDPGLEKRLDRIKLLAKKLVEHLAGARAIGLALTNLPASHLGFRKSDAAFQLSAEIGDLVAAAGVFVPRALCPYCKGLVDCAICENSMFVSRLEGVPEELTKSEPLMVWVNGKAELVEGLP